MKAQDLKKIIREEIAKILSEADDFYAPPAGAEYKGWNEFTHPDYIEVYLKDGRKLKISPAHLAGGRKIYYAILKAFNEDRLEVTNIVVQAMTDKLGGMLKK